MPLPERESLAEDLLLLALHNAHGTAQLKEKPLRSALATATVMDLLLGGKIAATDGAVIVVDRTPTNDPVRDRALACIGGAKTRTPLAECGGMIEAAIPDIATRLCEQLVARGALARQHARAFLHAGADRYPEQDGRIEQEVRARLRAVALHGAKPDPRTTLLATLVVGYHLDGPLFNDEERPLAQAQLREMAAQAHQRRQPGAQAAAGIVAGAQTAGATNVSGNAVMDFIADGGVGAAFELVFDVLPTLLSGLFELLSAFDN